MEGFAALSGGGGDEDDVASGFGCGLGVWLGFHLGDCGTDDAEDAVEIGAQGASPLLSGHGGDVRVVGRPDAVIENDAVEPAEGFDGGFDESAAVFGGGERLMDGLAEVGTAALGDEGFGLLNSGAVAEDDFGSGLAEETDGGTADAA